MVRFPAARVAARFIPVAALAAALGCGSGEGGYRVTGKVTFKGTPIPLGKIYFTPDSSKGNTGPTGYADIKDGAYDTGATGGRGFIGGPVIIGIEGYDPAAKGDKAKGEKGGEDTIKSLFPRYEVKADLPKAAGTKDIDVPADAAKAPVEKGPVGVNP